MDWLDDAACADADPELFFPEVGDLGWAVYKAKLICARCPVTTECLAAALANDEQFGVFGGKTVRERRRLKRRAA